MTSRREFLAGTAAFSAAALMLPNVARAEVKFDPQPGKWRTFSITTRIELADAGKAAHVWVPLPSLTEDAWIVPEGDEWSSNAASAEIITDPKYGAKLLRANFAVGNEPGVIEVRSRIRTQDRGAPFGGTRAAASLSDSERQLFLEPTELMPTDGIVKETADKITGGAGDAPLFIGVVNNPVKHRGQPEGLASMFYNSRTTWKLDRSLGYSRAPSAS